jgi:hypothetical protein
MPKVRFRAIDLGGLSILAMCLGVAPTPHAQELIQTPRGPGFLIYGNYCGPGNRGPRYKPIDALDLACAHHDACWPADPAALPACACNERLHVEAGLVAHDRRAPAQMRETAQFISDFATAIPCADPEDREGPAVPALPRLPAAR